MRAPSRRTPMTLWLLAGLMALSFCLLGCDDDDEVENLRPRELENRTVVFVDGRAFDVPSQPVTLVFGAFGQNNTPQLGAVTLTQPGVPGTATGLFFVEAEGNVFEDGIDLGPASECDLDITTSTLAAVPAGTRIHFDPCGFDQVTMELRLENEATNQASFGTVQ